MPRNVLVALLFASAALPLAAPAFAADPPAAVSTRVDRLEKQMKAVQRKVFPGGSPEFFEPEITAPAAPVTPEGTPATTPLQDLNSRVSALESELSNITGQIEQNNFKIRQLEENFNKLKAQYDSSTGVPPAGSAGLPPPGTPPFGLVTPLPAGKGTPVATPTVPLKPPAAGDAGPSTAPVPPVASTGDPGEDAYMAGYRLWADKKYPEAEAALKAVVDKYPKHKRASYAQNLLGRAYLDEGKPAMAAEAFYANYQKNPRGERAPDSLFYLGQSLMQLKKPKEACRVYDELRDVYGATMPASLKDKTTKARTDAACS
jgi:TolA-binding protein